MKSFWPRFLTNPRVIGGLAWLGLVTLLAILAPLLAPVDPFAIVAEPFIVPFSDYAFGTDSLGRDMWAGLVYGARTSLLIALIATVSAVAFGTLIGGVAGFYGGLIDDGLMRMTEFFQTIPNFALAIVLVEPREPGKTTLAV